MLTAPDPARGSRAPLFFCFDFASPHAYLAWCEIHSLAARHLRVVVPVPVRLTWLRKASGQRPLVEIDARQRYLVKHALRLAHEMGRRLVVPAASSPAAPPEVPLDLPLALTLASLELPGPEAQALRKALPEAQALRKALIDRLFAVAWAGAGSGRSRSELRRLLDELGLPAARLLAQAADRGATLRAQTEQAAADGVFDVPTVRVDGEVFFGVESLPHVERFLSGRDPLALAPLGASP